MITSFSITTKEVYNFRRDLCTFYTRDLQFRLTNIERVIPLSTESDFISKEKIAYLDEACKKPQYFNKQDIEVTVKFTDKGVSLLRTITKDRPTLVKKNSKYEYVFKGNNFQLKNYFWKYGPEVEILSPNKIRKLFINNISKLIEIYKEDNLDS